MQGDVEYYSLYPQCRQGRCLMAWRCGALSVLMLQSFVQKGDKVLTRFRVAV